MVAKTQGIQTAVTPKIDMAEAAADEARAAVKKTGQDTQIGTVKSDKENDKGMSLLMYYEMMRQEGPQAESDSDLAAEFAAFVKIAGLEDTEIEIGGTKVKLGEFAERLSSGHDAQGNAFADGYIPGVLSDARLPAGSPLSAKAVGNLEHLAQSRGTLGAIQRAAQVVGADYKFMLTCAYRESGFKANAQAGTSSAGGLFQFIDSTWVSMVQNHRGVLESQGIHVGNSRGEILGLKHNAFANALMGAELAKQGENYLERNVNVRGYQASAGDIYLSHFLGQRGAEKLIEAALSNPHANASALFPQAAAANRSIFAGRDVEDIRQWAQSKMGGPAPSPV